MPHRLWDTTANRLVRVDHPNAKTARSRDPAVLKSCNPKPLSAARQKPYAAGASATLTGAASAAGVFFSMARLSSTAFWESSLSLALIR